ncbi:N-acetyl sugar amidotransferase [Sulfurimonas sp. HSL1-6]|uniref:N-acetyl sugar amidotransferase n=1 Tax=Thiomicrolovo immobilis TaxID=3131935 RepID=UPI0031F993A6
MKTHYQICSQCVMDTTDPDITFDEQGVCNHCRHVENVIRKSWFPNPEGKRRLDQIVARIIEDGKSGEYDCVIGLSGGVDSSYLAYMLRTEYPQLRILAIHIDGGWNSELAVHNIEHIVKRLSIDLHTEVINWEEMKDLQLAYLKSQLANQDVPQDHAFFATLYKVAVDHFGIRYFLSGGNYATESILPAAWGYNAMDAKQLLAIHKRFGTIRLKTYETVGFFKRKIYYPYIKKFKMIRPLNFWPYDKEEAKRIIVEKLDWRDYGDKHHESIFTKFFQSYWLPEKFGYDKRRAHLSSMIVAGQMTRQEALNVLEKPPYNAGEIESEKEFIAKKLGITVEELNAIMLQPNKTFRDYPSDYALEQRFSRLKQYISKWRQR